MEDKANLFYTNPTTNSDCPKGAVIQEVLEPHYHSIQKNIEVSLSHHKLSEVISQVKILAKIA